VRGSGIGNDGVWANVSARPSAPVRVTNEAGESIIVPEESAKEAPPSYAVAQQDAVPQYWETTTVHAPSTLDSEILIDDLPSGNIWIFFFNLLVSFGFQFVGFLLTFLLHTSHAAKYGSRAGLGLTLIQYGFTSRSGGTGFGSDTNDPDEVPEWSGLSPNAVPSATPSETTPLPDNDIPDISVGGISSRDWLSFLLMTLGWFLLLSSFIGFWRIKRWERGIRTSTAPITAEERQRDLDVRRNIENVFGLVLESEEDEQQRRERRRQAVQVQHDANGRAVVIPTQELLEEARLARDLRAAGLL